MRKSCTVTGCERSVKGRGYCNTHYARFMRNGHPGPAEFRRAPNPKRLCEVEGCDRQHYGRGLCGLHYHRVQRTGEVGDAKPLYISRLGGCSVDGCSRERRSRGLCDKHLRRQRLYGDPLGKAVRVPSRGGTRLDRDGYVLEYQPEHPNAQSTGMVPQHRLVMSRHLGRPLLREESVHHRNGNRADNRIENLELWASFHPTGQAVDDLVPYAVEVLRRYAPDRLA